MSKTYRVHFNYKIDTDESSSYGHVDINKGAYDDIIKEIEGNATSGWFMTSKAIYLIKHITHITKID